jgi:hypothetical protein
MTALTLGEFLDKDLAFKARLNDYYAKIRDGVSDNGIRLLTYHLARGRNRHAVTLDDIPRETVHQARKTPFLYEAPFTLRSEFKLPGFEPATVTANDLIKEALHRQSRLAGRYRFIFTRSSHEAVRTVLPPLVRGEERDIELLTKMLAMGYFDR